MKLLRLPNKATFDKAKYSAEQMREYAQVCVDAEKERNAQICENLPRFSVGQIRADFAAAIRRTKK